ncbi:hemicentin-1-like isoform X2 [Dysidea avara]|uniref:hemicentin-1-like isoform X2 n=1 Tax=Dysidea avara TaxID=196820 RepID=UPI003321170E
MMSIFGSATAGMDLKSYRWIATSVTVLAFAVVVSTQCSSVELLVNDKQFTADTLYMPVMSNITVKCKCTDGQENNPNWFYSNGTEISECAQDSDLICTRSENKTEIVSLSLLLVDSYVCNYGSTSRRIYIDKLDPPEITGHLAGGAVPKGGSSMFMCKASGLGTLVYSWEKNSGSNWTTISNDNTTSYTTDTTLAIGEYKYRCRVSNEAGSVVSNSATVNVYGPPEITDHPTDSDVPMGKSITLMCKASGLGTLTYSWERKSSGRRWTTVSNDNTTSYTTDTTLTIGEYMYRCRVRNEAGSVVSNNATVNVYGPPEITDHPTGGDVPKGGSITLMCKASALGALAYSWERKSSHRRWTTVSNDNTTSYTTDTTSTIGEYKYRCRVSNEAGSVASNSATVNVYGPPTITAHPTSQYTTVNTSVTLNCTGDGQGSITYQWETSSVKKEEWKEISVTNNSRFVVTNLQESQQYRCIVSNEAGKTNSSTATIFVLKITTHPQKQLVAVGSMVNLTCTSSVSSDVTFSWTHNGRGVTGQPTPTGNTSILTITRVKRNDVGRYVCIVRHESLSVMSNTATLTVYGPPEITDHPTGGDVPIGRSITLMCKASALGTLTFSWERRSHRRWTTVSNDNTTSYTTDTTLTIGEYKYRCRVSNEAGSVVSNSATVNVYGPPTITTHPTSQYTTVNMSVTLNCTGDGQGPITYHWETSSVKKEEWKEISITNNSRFVVTNLQESQQYRCIVSNEAGRVNSNTATVVVLKITTHPQDRLVPVGSMVNLTCTSSVSSDVTFSWTHNGGGVTRQSTSTGNTSILTITRLKRNDAGRYVCIVRHESLSVMSNTATLTVYGPPEITDHPRDGDVPMGRSITLMCKASGLGTLVYSWERKSSHKRWTTVSNDSTTSYTTDTILAIGEYVYRCRVSNEAGSVVSNSATVNVYGPPEITDHPTDNDVPMGRSITLMCKASGLGTLTYSWERHSGRRLTTVSNDYLTSYTTTLTIGEYKYRCRVSNEAGSVVSNSSSVNVYGRPIITTHPTSQLTAVSMSVTLNCDGTGGGSITYQWESLNVKERRWTIVNNSTNRSLVVRNLQESQQYRCVVTNEAGRTRSKKAIVTILKITDQPSNPTTVVALEKIMLNCKSSIGDDVTYSWHRDSNGIPSRSTGKNSQTLTIPSATPRDEGMYYCKASKEGISVKSNRAVVTVNDKLFINATSPDQVIGEGETVWFTITASGINMRNFDYKWEKRGGQFSDRVRGINSTTLIIRSTLLSDEGQYYCNVTNEWGNSIRSDDITLTVEANKHEGWPLGVLGLHHL